MAEQLDNNVVLSVHNISKKYYNNKGQISGKGKEDNSFLAVDNVSFKLHKGEILGIIGQNGAGKSTLLKLLSEVIPPSSGYAEYEGSILSILDIGTGFHPDLSGYENIFLNASILGMKKSETLRKVDEIIDFSGIRSFINEPIKNYSNGMYLRLALSIALFTNNGIILLDEVISVGDAEFRMKAVQKIREQANAGRACIMISHDLNSIIQMCDNCLLLEKGKLIYAGKPAIAVRDYYEFVYNKLEGEKKQITEHAICKLISVKTEKETYYTDEAINLKIAFEVKISEKIRSIIKIRNHFGPVLTDCLAFREGQKIDVLEPGIYETTCQIPSNFLNAGNYLTDIMISNDLELYIDFKIAVKFTVLHRQWELNKNWNTTNEIYPTRARCKWDTLKKDEH